MLISDWSSDVCSSDLGVLPLLLLVVSGLGSERKGSQAWFALGPFQLQPSELAKVVVIVALASLIAHFNSELDAARLAGALALVGVPMALIMLQPDLGTTLVFVAVSMGMLLIGGAPIRPIVALTLRSAETRVGNEGVRPG